MEGWSQHPPVLEPLLLIQQKQTVAWGRDWYVNVSSRSGIKGTPGIIWSDSLGWNKERKFQ